METKRIVITGGPGSGKTTLINYLEKVGYAVMHEISRDVILEAQKEGIEQLFLENPLLFSEKLLEGRMQQFHEGKKCAEQILFYDRGMPDVTAYMDFIAMQYPENFSATCLNYKYDAIFLLPAWETIYLQDNERYETFEEAKKIFRFLKTGYEKYGYTIHEVPVGALKDRADFIFRTLNNYEL